MRLATVFRVVAVFVAFSSPVFSLTTESTKLISGIEKVVEQAHNVDTSLKNFDGGIRNAISTAQALFYSQKASNELQDDLCNEDQLPAEDMLQFLTALGGLHTAIVNATKTAASQAPLMKSTGYKRYATNTLYFYTSENKAYANAIMSKIPDHFQHEVDEMVEVNAAELDNVLALFE